MSIVNVVQQSHSEQNCGSCNEESAREFRTSIYLISAAAFFVLSTLPAIPVPYSIGFSAMCGASMFFSFYEVPKSEEWPSEVKRPSRTWKHLAAGALFSAAGLGAAFTGIKIKSFNVLFPFAGLVMPLAGWFICQSDIFCKGNYIYEPISQNDLSHIEEGFSEE